MRVFGSFFVFIGLISLISGVVLGLVVFSSANELYLRVEESREVVSERVDDVSSTISDMNDLIEDINELIIRYQRDGVYGIQNEELDSTLKDVAEFIEKSKDLRNDIDDEAQDLKELKDDLNQAIDQNMVLTFCSLGCLILSGWIFALGIWIRKSAN